MWKVNNVPCLFILLLLLFSLEFILIILYRKILFPIINHRPSFALETGGRLLPKIRKQMEDVTGDAAGAPAGGDVAEVSTQSTAGNVSIRDDAPQQKKQYNFIRKRRAALCYRGKKGPNQKDSNHPHGSTPTNNADATAPSLPTRPSPERRHILRMGHVAS